MDNSQKRRLNVEAGKHPSDGLLSPREGDGATKVPKGAKLITTLKGDCILVDEEDYPALAGDNWFASHDAGDPSYAVRTEPSPARKDRWVTVRMHRQLLNAASGISVDHANGDGLDNRRANLRFATHSQQCRNARKRIGGHSRFKGVKLENRWGGAVKWVSGIKLNNTAITLGVFRTEEEAAHAYDAAAFSHFGCFARFNFNADGSAKAALSGGVK